MGIKIGNSLRRHEEIYISRRAFNPSILITGLSGTGKSYKLFQLERNILEDGGNLLIIDFHGAHENENFLKILGETSDMKRIDISEMGIPMSLLNPLTLADGNCEKAEDVANAVLKIFSEITHLGDRQSATLRQAILATVKDRHMFASNEMRGIDEALKRMDDPRAEVLREKLWFYLHKCNTSANLDILGMSKCNICDLNGYDFETQPQVAELILNLMWRYVTRYGAQNDGMLYIVCDEAHNLAAKGVISKILREGRKHHVGLILATQTLQSYQKEKRAVLEQAATKLYFRPTGTEALQLATMIKAEKRKFWREQLLRLRTGQCVAEGTFEYSSGAEIHRPLVLSERIDVPGYADCCWKYN